MRYTRPKPYAEAVRAAQVRSLLPTAMTTRELDQLGVQIRARARFSAQVQLAEHLDVLDGGIGDLVAGTTDLASARLRVKEFLQELGYAPDPAARGGLKDFSSAQRINLQLRMGAQQAQGAGWHLQSQDETLLDAFPAQEFLRVEARETERQDWPERWDAARAATTTEGATLSSSGRMVALKNHPLWAKLSRFGLPYEPFDFGSGMGTEDVGRREAMGLGIIGRDTRIPPDRSTDFNAELQAKPAVRSAQLRAAIEQSGVGRFDAAGVLHFAGGRP